MGQAISTPAIKIDGDTIGIVPNSAIFTLGSGETIVRAASAGGNSVEAIHTVNAESKIGDFKVGLYVTADNLRLIQTLKSRVGLIEIGAIDSVVQTTSASITLQNASLCNDPEAGLGADTTMTFEFKGSPATVG